MKIESYTPVTGNPFFYAKTQHGFLCSYRKDFEDVWFCDDLNSDEPQYGPEGRELDALITEVVAANKNSITLKPDQKLRDAVMDDSGDSYFTTFEYRVEGDEELLGDQWRDGRIVWMVTDAWRAEEERVREEMAQNERDGYSNRFVDIGILDDQSEACDWGNFAVIDEAGNDITGMVADEIRAML
jgi:hypothetical protein